MKRALITGITGQDGSYLAELLLSKGYEVHGLIRRASTFNTSRIDHLYVDPHQPDARLFLHYGDLTDGTRLVTLLSTIEPDEVYNLAAQSHVRVSFDEPVHAGDTTGMGSVRLLEAVRLSRVDCRFYQASSSEMFGASPHRLRTSRRRSIRAHRMVWRRSIRTGRRATIGRRTACSRRTASCSTTNLRGAVRHS